MEYAEQQEADVRGHRVFDFDDPVSVSGREYSGFKREIRKSTYLDEEKAEERLREKGVYETVIKTVEVIDQDLVFVRYQEGLIDDDDIAYMFVTQETYALKER